MRRKRVTPHSLKRCTPEPDRLRGFLSAMTGLSRKANIGIASKFPWGQYKTAVDVGTAQGDLIVQIALAHKHITGGGFDLPKVGPIFEDYVDGNNLSDRLEFMPGSFFDDDFPKADIVTMGHILHDWDLEEKKMLLRKAHKAVPTGGAVIVYESLIDDDRSKNAFGLLMSLNMLIETPGGFDYTGSNCMTWMREAGLHGHRHQISGSGGWGDERAFVRPGPGVHSRHRFRRVFS